MTPISTTMKFDLAMKRGDVREMLGWNFVRRLEKLVDELLRKPDCPSRFWVIFSAKYCTHSKKIKEMWQVTDEKPKNPMLGQAIYEIDKSGKAECWALPLDIPVPDEELSDEIVGDNYEKTMNLILSDQTFVKKSLVN